MMYVEIVKETMNNQKEARKEFKIAQAKEREVVAIDILEDAKCAIKELKCEHLLDTVEETVVNNTISINKGKIVKVEVEKIVPKEVIKEVVKTKEVKVVDAETLKQLETARKSVATWQSKANKLQVTVTEKDKLIAELKKQIEELKAPKQQEEPMDEYEEYLSSQEYQEYLLKEIVEEDSNECVIFGEQIKEQKQEESKQQESVKEEAVTIEKLDVKLQKYSNASIFKYTNGYFIASPKAEEITWLPNGHEVLSQNTKDEIVNQLIANYKFFNNRTTVSPYKVTRDNAYFARVAAIDGVETFSPNDIFSGYVFLQGQYYLFTYQPAEQSVVFVDSLIKKVNGQISRPSKVKKNQIDKMVKDMYEEYKGLIVSDNKPETIEQPVVKEEKKEEGDLNSVNSLVSKVARQRRQQRAANRSKKKASSALDILNGMYGDALNLTIDDSNVQNNTDSTKERLAVLGK